MIGFGDRTGRGAAHEVRVLREHTARRVRFVRFPRAAPPAQLRTGQVRADVPFDCVNRDTVSVSEQADGTTDCGFGRDVPYDKAVAAS